MEDGNVYVYDFSELREDVHAVETDVEAVQTQISELNSQMSDNISQVSEIISYMSVTADNTTAIKAQTEIEVILFFAVIAFCGMVCGLLIANCIRK